MGVPLSIPSGACEEVQIKSDAITGAVDQSVYIQTEVWMSFCAWLYQHQSTHNPLSHLINLIYLNWEKLAHLLHNIIYVCRWPWILHRCAWADTRMVPQGYLVCVSVHVHLSVLLCNMGFLVAFIEAKVNTGTKTHKQTQGDKLAYY